jgi:phosphotransferase system enzyme I (PtsI)
MTAFGPGMTVRHGIPVSAGVAIGPLLILDTEGFRIPARRVAAAAVDNEVARLAEALSAAARDSRTDRQSVDDKLGRKYGAIFEAHALLLEDPALVGEIESLIRDHAFSAEYALSRVLRGYAKALQDIHGSHSFATRSTDLYDIERRVLAHLLGESRQSLRNLREPVVILAHDLTPSETAQLEPSKVHGFATEAGGRTSHTAILAGALELPAVVGLGPFLAEMSGGDDAIIDGHRGLLIINPDDDTRAQYESARAEYVRVEESLGALRDVPAVTADGHRVRIFANIEFPHEVAHALERGAEGIGLYRTEFLYLGREREPTEDEQFLAFLSVIRELGPGRPLVIRTLDIGADKVCTANGLADPEQNPVLGLRSIRLCLRNRGLFVPHLRAILRASAHGDVSILFPMITTLRELRHCKIELSEVKEDLQEQGVAFNPNVRIGTMIEVPSAALLAERLVREVDYLSVGTNDLVQYTLASDRTNEHVADLYSASDPAVLQLVKRVLDAAGAVKKPVNVCGEMSGEPIYAALLLGLGLTQFSVTAHNIPAVKRVIRAVTLKEAREIAEEALLLETATEVTNYLRGRTLRLLPDANL